MTNDTPTTTTNIYLGLSIEVAGQNVNINPTTAISDIKKQGFKGSIDKPLQLGSVSSMFNGITKQFEIKKEGSGEDYDWNEITKSVKGIPVVEGAVSQLGDANLTIEELSIAMPPTQDADGKTIVPEKMPATKFTIALSMVRSEESGKLFGGIALKGLYFKAERK